MGNTLNKIVVKIENCGSIDLLKSWLKNLDSADVENEKIGALRLIAKLLLLDEIERREKEAI